MREKIAIFGERGSLVGIVSEPENGLKSNGSPAVVLLNSGLLHRVGPNRLYVKIARGLAAAGIPALRFDLSGIGDSQRTGNLSQEESAIRDVKLAMDFLSQTRGIQSFILTGICSGADNAFQTACVDPRVIGIVMIDGFSFATTGYILNSYLKLLLKWRSWQRLISGKSDILRFIKEKLKSPVTDDADQIDPYWPAPDNKQVIAGFNALAKKGVELCFIYSSGGAAHFNYKKFYANTLKSLSQFNRIQIKVFEGTDHLFSPLYIQESLVKAIRNWVMQVPAKQNLQIKMFNK